MSGIALLARYFSCAILIMCSLIIRYYHPQISITTKNIVSEYPALFLDTPLIQASTELVLYGNGGLILSIRGPEKYRWLVINTVPHITFILFWKAGIHIKELRHSCSAGSGKLGHSQRSFPWVRGAERADNPLKPFQIKSVNPWNDYHCVPRSQYHAP